MSDDSRIASLESKVDVLIAELRIKNEASEKILNRLVNTVYGDPGADSEDGKVGMDEKVRNLEESEKGRKATSAVFRGGVVLLFLNKAWEIFIK